jgi:hypothetical protein
MFLLLLACGTGEKEETVAPSLSWLSPRDGESVAIGNLSCALIIESFSLVDPAKHNEGAPIGYVAVARDGIDILDVGSTTFDLNLDAGDHTLGATLYYADYDKVSVKDGLLCDEDEDGCAPVEASIAVTVE